MRRVTRIVLVAFLLTGCGDGDGRSTESDAGYRDTIESAIDVTGSPEAINTFWGEEFPQVWPRLDYAPPTAFVRYAGGEIPKTACSDDPDPDQYAANAFYCTGDESISWDDTWLEDLYRDVGRLAPIVVLAHEWGHHIQLRGSALRPDFTIRGELQADCMAGLYLGNLERVGGADGADVRAVELNFFDLADEEGTPWFDPGAHGSADERLASFTLGRVTGDIENCLRMGSEPLGPTAQAGPYTIALDEDSTVTGLQGTVHVTRPGQRASADIRGWSWDELPGTGNQASDRLDASAAQQLGGTWTFVEDLSSIDFDGMQVALADLLALPGNVTVAAGRYEQQSQEGSFEGVFVLVAEPGIGALALDIYVPAPAGEGDPEGVLDYLIRLTAGIRR